MPSGAFILARAGAAALRAALERQIGPFKTKWFPWGNAPYALGEYAGAAYLSDAEGALVELIDPDVFVAASRELGGLVVAVSYETVSVSSFFLAVDKGELVRMRVSSTGLREPLERGVPLPSESVVPLDRADGLMVAVTAFGFQLPEWLRAGTRVSLRGRDDLRTEPASTIDAPLALGEALRAHRRLHDIPFDEWLKDFQTQVVGTHAADPAAAFALRNGGGSFKLEMQRRGEPAKEPSPRPEIAPFDRAHLFPQIVPVGYLAESPGAVRLPLVDGLEVALVCHQDTGAPSGGVGVGFAWYVDASELEKRSLAPREAFAIGLENLLAEVKSGRVQPMAIEGDAGKVEVILWDGHWLAAACLLLPTLGERMKDTLGGDDLVTVFPHRDFLAIFPRRVAAARVKQFLEGEKAGRKRITERVFRLVPGAPAPFFDRAPIAALEE
jgi:hypothetical protein